MITALLHQINIAIAAAFFICYLYQIAYILIPFIKKHEPHKETKLHNYAVLICARNEEKVIGHLIDSIRAQDYPSDKVAVFVAADNCTDNTAAVSRMAGAVVYERFDMAHVGKGYALDYLLSCIAEDHPAEFDGYFVFDADNLLSPDYITEMNKTFSDGYDIVTCYRNSKNYGDNWISAGNGLSFLRDSKYLNNSRQLLGVSCAVSGTGFMFSKRVLDKLGGWSFHLLTEDTEFTVSSVLEGERIGYAPDAVIYDEQPVKFRQSCRQRMRWAKGYLQVFSKYGGRLIKGIFGKDGLSCYDMSMAIMPAIVLTAVCVIVNILSALMLLMSGGGVADAVISAVKSIFGSYMLLYVMGLITTVTEWKRIHTTARRKVLYTFTFPIFMLTYIPISLAAMFRKVEWKPIEHSVAISVKEV
jgi:cellulose synthase/poly-beta-1,6-N-acetylglucosamine synthase-like glycosyltransferase